MRTPGSNENFFTINTTNLNQIQNYWLKLNFLIGSHKGPTETKRTKMLNATLEGFPDKKEPVLSKQNQDNIPVKTVFLTASGA